MIGEFLIAILLIIGSIIFPLFSQAQKAKDGNYSFSPGSATTVIPNRYSALSATASAGATSVTVTNITELAGSFSFTNSVNTFATSALAAGDLVMIIQVQGATIDQTNTASYGSISTYNGAGNYKLRTVQTVAGNTINFCVALTYTYTQGGTARSQVVRIPRYNAVTLGTNATVAAMAWSGTVGGICALEIEGSLTLNGTISATALGFRGGTYFDGAGSYGITTYRSTTANDGAFKGESIAGNQTDYAGMNGQYGSVAPANGGGGGNAHNAGGGGGANAGNNGSLTPWNGTGIKNTSTGTWANAWNLEAANFATDVSRGGGRGGYTYSANNQDALTVAPGNAAWGGDNRQNNGGIGGRPLDYNGNTRLFMGGGGGAGDGNNNSGGSGGNGGGIVYLLVTGAVSGTGTITANGNAGASTSNTHKDAPGGGGGAIIVLSNATITSISMSANGGNGGNQLATYVDEGEGPGGGGGGGYILTTSTSVTRSVAGRN